MSFGYVPPPFKVETWRAVRSLLRKTVERFGSDWNELHQTLVERQAQLWMMLDQDIPAAAMVTRMDGDTLEVWLAGGRVIEAIPHLETTIEAATKAGATNGRITGRRGWARALRSYGWKTQGDDLVKRWA